jgi:hypothetical protein
MGKQVACIPMVALDTFKVKWLPLLLGPLIGPLRMHASASLGSIKCTPVWYGVLRNGMYSDENISNTGQGVLCLGEYGDR